MGPGTKNRIKLHAAKCKSYLREKHSKFPSIVEEFITEIQGVRKTFDESNWNRFGDEKLQDLEKEFQDYLNGN